MKHAALKLISYKLNGQTFTILVDDFKKKN